MSSEPYMPDEDDLVDVFAIDPGWSGHDDGRAAEARRGIAKIKADALRSFADELEASLTISSGSDDALTVGVLRERADEIEEEA